MDYMTLYNAILSFILVLYAKPNFPRNVVDIIITFIYKFIKKDFCISLETCILKIVTDAKCEPEVAQKIRQCFKEHCRIFDNFLTESNRFNLLKTRGFQEPEEFKIHETYVEEIQNDKPVFVKKSIYAVRISLTDSLKKFLVIPNMAKSILENVKKLSAECNVISNVIQGRFWKAKFTNSLNVISKEYMLPLFVYYDEIEVGNALGSHSGKNKFGVTYASIACLPASIASHLNSIIFCMLVRANDMKLCSNEDAFKNLIDELNILQTIGVTVLIDGVPNTFKFQTVLILGDNLGLNQICRFVQSFKANAFCRVCKADSFDCSQMCDENKNLLRTPENYESDFLLSDTTQTGIKESCIFNQLNNFHVAINKSVDFMHDVLEGVCLYVIHNILYEFIYKQKYFTLEYLNLRIQEFILYSNDSNKPPPITLNQNKEKLNIKYSGAEMLFITRYLGAIIAHKIPADNKHWRMYIGLRKIVDILMSPRIVTAHIEELRVLVKELNSSYLSFYGKLKPKFHFLTHYASLLYLFGPCIHFWTMRYESRHTDIKANAVATNSTQNLLKIIALKQILQMCKIFNDIEFVSNITFKLSTNCKKVYVNNTEYSIGMFIVINITEPEIQFGEIIDIQKAAKSEESEERVGKDKGGIKDCVLFTVRIYEEFYFDEHCMVYVTINKNELKTVDLEEIPAMPPVAAIEKGTFHWIIPRYRL